MILSLSCERKTRLELATLTLARLCSTNWAISANLVKEMRLELTRQYCHYPLKVARLPIPPFLQIGLKSHCVVVPRTRLELARLSTLAPETSASTIPPPGQAFKVRFLPLERKTRLELATLTLARLCSTNWAISAFLHPRVVFSFADAKVDLFFESPKLFHEIYWIILFGCT